MIICSYDLIIYCNNSCGINIVHSKPEPSRGHYWRSQKHEFFYGCTGGGGGGRKKDVAKQALSFSSKKERIDELA